MSKTASELRKKGWPAEEMAKYQPWKALDKYSQDSEIKARKDHALSIAHKVGGLLKAKYGATRVVLFGSLAHGAWFTPRSDIDIYVEGISAARFFEAEADIQEISQKFKVDLVDSKECSPELLSKIEEEGIDL